MKTKKILAAILSMVMVFGLMQITTNASDTAVEITPDYTWYGDGTAEEFAIATVEQLAGLAKLTQGNVVADETTLTKTDFAGKTVKLTENLTFADNQYWYYCNSDSTTVYNYRIGKFAGVFDGQGNTITGLKFCNENISQNPYMYLFETITAEGSIRNIILDTVTADINGSDYFGFLAKTLNGSATNCHVKNATANVAVDKNNKAYLCQTAAMFGYVYSATVTDCTASVVTINAPDGVDTTDRVGALVGQSSGTTEAPTTISNCSVSDVELNLAYKTKQLGGFVGSTNYTRMLNCTATDVDISIGSYYQNVGGFVGAVGSCSTYDNCTLDGFVLDANSTDVAGYVGGFACYVKGTDISFINCAVTGLDMDLEFRYEDYGYVGGFASYVSGSDAVTIKNCSVSGAITAVGTDSNLPVGGFIGSTLNTKLVVEECTANVDITTPYTAGGFIGVSKGGSFTNCEANGDVTADIAGGFVGEIVPTSSNVSVTIDTCEANGTVTGETVASGFVGQMTTSMEDDTNTISVTITNSTAAADIQSENGEVIAFAKETISSGSNSHYVPSGNVIKFDKVVTLSADDAVVGSNVFVSVNIEGEGSFNASELVVSYPDSLIYNESASTLNDATVTAEDGVLKLVDYGVAQGYGDDVYVLVFDAVEGGTANIALTSAGFGTAASSETDDLAMADCENVAVVVTVKNNVTLDEIFEGANTVMNGSDYTFSMESATGGQYNYDLPTATIDDTSVDVVANADGTWTVENVTGELVITGIRTPKTHNVVINGDTAANDGETATYGTDYTFTLADDLAASTLPGYVYAVESITIGGVEYTSYAASERVYTILGTDITGDIEITISKTEIEPNQFNITVTGNGAGAATLSANVVDKNGSVTLTLAPEAGWSYTVTAGDYEVVQEGNVYTVSDITTAVEFTVIKEVIVSSAYAAEYVTLDGTEMWLVKIGTEQIDGKVYTYDGQKMFWSEQYSAYATLVVSETKPVIESANFSIETGDARVLAANNKDVNMTGTVDANDAQLVWNIYNATYSNFTDTVTVEKFLRADVNGDETVTIEDATAIVNAILNK